MGSLVVGSLVVGSAVVGSLVVGSAVVGLLVVPNNRKLNSKYFHFAKMIKI